MPRLPPRRFARRARRSGCPPQPWRCWAISTPISRIIPVVARLTPPFDLVINPQEVVEAFEVPFAHLMSEANHQLKERTWQAQTWHFYAMDYGDRTVWGITAGILRILYEKLYL